MRSENPATLIPSFATQTVVTGSKALTTTYRNTGSTPRLVCASFILPQNGAIVCYCDTGASPSAEVAYVRNNNLLTQISTISLLVLPLYYYNFIPGGSETVECWVEYN